MAHDGAIALELVESLSPSEVSEVRRIYEEGFPPHQRADFVELIEQRQPGEFALALVRGRQPCGFAMLRPLGDTDWAYLRYFVVDRSQRSRGLGGLFWDRLTARLRAAGFTLLVFDVEDPAEPGYEVDQSRLRSRRISFYQRHGASLLPVRGFRAPHPAVDGPDSTPMLVMAAPLAGNSLAPNAGRTRAIVVAVYRYRWQLEPGHPLVAAIQVGDHAGLPWIHDAS